MEPNSPGMVHAQPRRLAPRPQRMLERKSNVGVAVVATIGLLSTVRGWQLITPGQRHVQLAMSAAACFIFAISLTAPKFYERHHTLWVMASRFVIMLMPAVTQLIAGLLGCPAASSAATSSLGVRWAYRNPLGALGIILFASRMPMIGVASLYTPMPLRVSLPTQLALATAASSTDHVMCSSTLAHGPEVLPWLKAAHWGLSGAWDLIVPAPWNPLPPRVVRPGVSLLAVTLLVRLTCVVVPLAVNVVREARQYRELLVAVARGGAAAARGRPIPKRAPAAARIDLFFRRLGHYPVHAAFFGLACLELAWCACLAAAERVCAA